MGPEWEVKESRRTGMKLIVDKMGNQIGTIHEDVADRVCASVNLCWEADDDQLEYAVRPSDLSSEEELIHALEYTGSGIIPQEPRGLVELLESKKLPENVLQVIRDWAATPTSEMDWNG